MTQAMDDFDKRILDIIQSNFPLTSRPYAAVGEQVGLAEDEVLARVRALKASGVIRRMGANFDSRGLKWQSTLCAAKVPPERVDEFAALIDAIDGATHNYLRDHEYNIWFTLIAPDMDAVEAILADITAKTGIKVLNLPATKMFKIKVDFKMAD